ncbi:MAG: hypothetical protein Q8P07_05360 [bacterium]|nr:hypothetical protein [bacterium]
MMKVKLLVLALTVSLLSACSMASVGKSVNDVVMAGPNVVAAVGHELVAGPDDKGLLRETLTKPSHATFWRWVRAPLTVTNAVLDSVSKSWDDLVDHLHGR